MVAERQKGNGDADLVLHAVLEKANYDKAVIITSDGDFYSLARHLYENEKLAMVLSPYIKTCSKLLKLEAKEKINYMLKTCCTLRKYCLNLLFVNINRP